jgi:hypothetical protein
MGYKKNGKGTQIRINTDGEFLNVYTNYYNKAVSYCYDIKEHKTAIIVSAFKNYTLWRRDLFLNKYISQELIINDKIYFINANENQFYLQEQKTMKGLIVGSDYDNILMSKNIDKLCSQILSLIKTNKEKSLIHVENTRYIINPDMITGIIKHFEKEKINFSIN